MKSNNLHCWIVDTGRLLPLLHTVISFFFFLSTFLLKYRNPTVVHCYIFHICYDGLSHTKCSGQDWCVAYSVFHKVYSFCAESTLNLTHILLPLFHAVSGEFNGTDLKKRKKKRKRKRNKQNEQVERGNWYPLPVGVCACAVCVCVDVCVH